VILAKDFVVRDTVELPATVQMHAMCSGKDGKWVPAVVRRGCRDDETTSAISAWSIRTEQLAPLSDEVKCRCYDLYRTLRDH
jgi:hypothetical protein